MNSAGLCQLIATENGICFWYVAGPPGKPKGPIEVLDVQKDNVLISWKPPEDTGGKPLT